MIVHYLKVAVRNLLKYKTQSVISILGLAIGFVCFALSSMWMKYETTYDTFHNDAERIYYVKANTSLVNTSKEYLLPYPLGRQLKEIHSEIEAYAVFNRIPQRLYVGETRKEVNFVTADSSFIHMMGVEVLSGNTNFMLEGSNEVAITESMAKELFGNHNPLGKEVSLDNNTKTIGAVVSGWEGHSNLNYDFMGDINYPKMWDFHMFRILVKLKKGVNPEDMQRKMNKYFPKEITTNEREKDKTALELISLPKLHLSKGYFGNSNNTFYMGNIGFHYIVYFSVSGLLIIACALVNYLTIFINRMRVRSKEMALRKINGASYASLVTLLSTEFVLLLVCAMFMGMMITEFVFPAFSSYTQIEKGQASMYIETATYFSAVGCMALLVMMAIVCHFQRHNLSSSLLLGRGERLFRKASILIQLVVCLLFISCTVMMNRQLNFLRHKELGMTHHNIGSLAIWYEEDLNVWKDRIATLPMVERVLPPKYNPLVAQGSYGIFVAGSWDNNQGGTDEGNISLNLLYGGKDLFDLYNIELVSGKDIAEEGKPGEIWITDATAKAFGWTPQEAVGKRVYYYTAKSFSQVVAGVVKECVYYSPSAPKPYTAFTSTEKQVPNSRPAVLFQFKEGTWEACEEIIGKMYEETCPDKWLRLYSEEEAFEKYLRSENALTRLLEAASLVCILISVFGVYSLITLTCEQRRKEIAIRKINGAKVHTILNMFAKEYAIVLLVSSAIAFPVAYGIMQLWKQTYNRQIETCWIPFAIIFVGISLLIATTIGYRVWKTANENPAEVVKSE